MTKVTIEDLIKEGIVVPEKITDTGKRNFTKFATNFTRFFADEIPTKSVEQEEPSEISSSFADIKERVKGSPFKALNSDNIGEYTVRNFRMLSSSPNVKGVIDFNAKPGILESAYQKGIFNYKKFFKDHNMSVDSHVGYTSEAWLGLEKEYPGVNCSVCVRDNVDPSFATKFKEGMIDAVSVGINYNWEPSHEFDYKWMFWELLGTVVGGSTVRLIVTEVTGIRELSAVSFGADSNATALSEDHNYIEDLKDNKAEESQEKLENLTKELESTKKSEETHLAEIESLKAKVAELELKLVESAPHTQFFIDQLNRRKAVLLKNATLLGISGLQPKLELCENVDDLEFFEKIVEDLMGAKLPNRQVSLASGEKKSSPVTVEREKR